MVTTTYPGANADEVELEVTDRIEMAIQEIQMKLRPAKWTSLDWGPATALWMPVSPIAVRRTAINSQGVRGWWRSFNLGGAISAIVAP